MGRQISCCDSQWAVRSMLIAQLQKTRPFDVSNQHIGTELR